MKQSLIPTQYLLIEAKTASSWDSCDFILLKLTEELLASLAHRAKIAKNLQTEKEFEYVAFYEAPLGFFVDTEDISEVLERMMESDTERTYVITDEMEIENLKNPEASLDIHILKVDGFGNAWYTAIGEYSGEEYYSRPFKVEEILYELENNEIL